MIRSRKSCSDVRHVVVDDVEDGGEDSGVEVLPAAGRLLAGKRKGGLDRSLQRRRSVARQVGQQADGAVVANPSVRPKTRSRVAGSNAELHEACVIICHNVEDIPLSARAFSAKATALL
jgi:hypothetical protein